ncbi:MAG: hypothetical protein II479_01625 [Bacteroidales bacterium]|nr:hypothetical protein [Bacteroidales bacterium]
MKRLFLAAFVLILLTACSGGDRLRTGDLIFVGIPLDYAAEAPADSMDTAIAASTGVAGGLNLIHVAIAEVKADSVWIIDATLRHGVDRHPLDTFLTDFTLKDGSLPVFIVKRAEGVDPEAAVGKAKTFCGQPYDLYFLPDNGAMYCSELVRESFLDAAGRPVFDNEPMNFRAADGSMPPYWEWLFGRLGTPVPQGLPGTNPQGMSASPVLKEVPVRDFPLR